jgi:multicomponent Na+:H+ antiporter subunit F
MADFLLSAGAFVVLMVALGLVRVGRGPGRAERMMAAQLLGTGAIGALLLFGAASGDGAMFDVALTLALLSAFASIAFVKFALRQDQNVSDDAEEGARLVRRAVPRRSSRSAPRQGLYGERHARCLQHYRHRRRPGVLSRRHGRAAALPRCVHAAACADQGR